MGKRVSWQLFNRTIERKCSVCDKTFSFVRSKGKHPEHCGNACKQKAYRQRMEERAYSRLGENYLNKN